ncbi:hypothetical protein FOL47_005848 [Perkinsus chesapeaki]|uniref:RING-type E3 ubiquitin transferase (cysteine targeting) n=1 Tax=Perkinsus chesapeaki TaxID=330153 RepID=A0A7J6LVD0_PERCH|nr:hypothetical protein FOL47_005848 [Perkinsus chesapeaki]
MLALRSDEIDAITVDDDTIDQVERCAVNAIPGRLGCRWRSEIRLALETALWYFYLCKRRPTPGQELFNINYVAPSSRQKILLLLLGPFLSYWWTKFKIRGRLSSDLISILDGLKLLHWICFLAGAKGFHASPVATVLGVKPVQIDPQAQRVHQLDYFHRYLFVQHFTEFLTAVWPLMANTALFKKASRRLSALGRRPPSSRVCAVCSCQLQIGSQQASPCGCRICYYCWQTEDAATKGRCPACGAALG